MKPFQFDRILDHRKQLEEIAANRLFVAEREARLVRKKLSDETKHLDFLIKKTEELQSEAISILVLINHENQINFLKNTILAIQTKLQQKTERMEQERANLIVKSRNRQVMENLKEKQNRTWKQYLDKKELSMLDEIAVVRHGKEAEF